MRLSLIILFMVLGSLVFSQTSPKFNFVVDDSDTQFGINLPRGCIIYDLAGDSLYILTVAAASTATINTASWSLLYPQPDTDDHGALSGLTDDDHTQYALLAGRAGDTLNINTIQAITPEDTLRINKELMVGTGTSNPMIAFGDHKTYMRRSGTYDRTITMRIVTGEIIFRDDADGAIMLYPNVTYDSYLGVSWAPWTLVYSHWLRTDNILDDGTNVLLNVPVKAYDTVLVTQGDTVGKKLLVIPETNWDTLANYQAKADTSTYDATRAWVTGQGYLTDALQWSDTTQVAGVGLATYNDIRDMITSETDPNFTADVRDSVLAVASDEGWISSSSWVGTATSDLNMNSYDIKSVDSLIVSYIKVSSAAYICCRNYSSATITTNSTSTFFPITNATKNYLSVTASLNVSVSNDTIFVTHAGYYDLYFGISFQSSSTTQCNWRINFNTTDGATFAPRITNSASTSAHHFVAINEIRYVSAGGYIVPGINNNTSTLINPTITNINLTVKRLVSNW